MSQPRKTWSQFPVRHCYRVHACMLCDEKITCDQCYVDGGAGRRAHYNCVDQSGKWDEPLPSGFAL